MVASRRDSPSLVASWSTVAGCQSDQHSTQPNFQTIITARLTLLYIEFHHGVFYNGYEPFALTNTAILHTTMMHRRIKRRRLCSDVPDLYKVSTKQSFSDRVKSWDEMLSPAHEPWSGDDNRVSAQLREAVRIEPAVRQSETRKTGLVPTQDNTLLELAGVQTHKNIYRLSPNPFRRILPCWH